MRHGATARAAVAVGAVLFLFSTAAATQPSLRDAERQRARAEAQRKKIEADARKSARAVDDLRQSLVMAAAQQRTAEEEVARLEIEVRTLREREAALHAQTWQAQGRLEQSLIALYRADALAWDGPGIAVASAIGRESARDVSALTADGTEVARRKALLAERQAALAEARRDLEDREAKLSALLAREQAHETQLNRGLTAALAREQAAAQQAQNLRDLVRRSAARRPSVQSASLARPATRSPVTQSARTSALPAALAGLAPASSTIVRRYGARYGSGAAAHVSQGITLRTRPGAQILSPANAVVGYAGPFRGYHSVLILNLEGDYAVVLTGLETIRVRTGQEVLAGQPVAEMEPDVAYGATGSPELYVEVRRSGNPVDPSGLPAAGRGRIAP